MTIDIRLLGRILGDVIREQEGVEAYELVEQVRQMRDDGATYRQICHALCLPKSTVRDFVTYKRRACTVAGFRRVAD